ncbi:hypothetical protein CHU98_g979 [Xylaria longipes]|nr:hypothetical protein CHU98_g979 [Xylaria longipes]
MSVARRLRSLKLTSPRPASLLYRFRIRMQHNSSSAIGEIKFDQTKESNDPLKGLKPEHKAHAKQTGSNEGEDHPAKQPDPQPAPSKSTGVRYDGPDSKAGEGRDKGVTKDNDFMPSTVPKGTHNALEVLVALDKTAAPMKEWLPARRA